jgi:hypothetical protein
MQPRTKYPRTPHLPYSRTLGDDDRVLEDTFHLRGREVVVTVKMDGENTSLYRDGFHARSLDSRHHPSRDWIARFHGALAHDIPEGWRVCGENLFAKHAIAYSSLPSFFLGFSVWNERNTALGWDDTLEFFALLGIESVPVVYRGPFEDAHMTSLIEALDTERDEGLVVRLAGPIDYGDFGRCVAKWVREGHVAASSEHWMTKALVPNGMANRR